MHKRILSLAMALILTLALVPTVALAAENLEIPGGIITNVTSTSGEYAAEWHKQDNITVQEWGDVKTYYVNAPCRLGGDFVYGTTDLYETGEASPNEANISTPGTYLFGIGIWGDEEHVTVSYGFYVVLGGSSTPAPTPTPAPTTPATPTPTPAVTPVPSTPATGNAAALKTTAGLVTVIPPAPTTGQDLAYTVQAGETIWGIAYNYYGSMSDSTVSKIKSANAAYFKKTKNILEAGAVITLPAKGLINPVTQGGLDKAAGVYLVKAGDTLADIAKVYYGDMKEWRKIYEANKDRVKLVSGSPMIYEKQWLVIPE